MDSSSKTTVSFRAVLIAYSLYSFSMQPTTSATPGVRGGIPSLYMQPTAAVAPTPGVRGGIPSLDMQSTAAVAPGVRGGASAIEASRTHEQDDDAAPFEAYAFFEVVAVLISMVALLKVVPSCRSSTCATTTCSAALVAYTLFAFGLPVTTMSATSHLRGGIPSLYMQQPTLSTTRGLRSSGAFAVENEMLVAHSVLEVGAVLFAVMALAQRIPPSSRSLTRATTTGIAILIAYALFSFGVQHRMSVTPGVRAGVPSFYKQPALRTTTGLRDYTDGGYQESYSDWTDTLGQTCSPMAYWIALSVPAMAMTHLTQRKEHAKLQ